MKSKTIMMAAMSIALLTANIPMHGNTRVVIGIGAVLVAGYALKQYCTKPEDKTAAAKLKDCEKQTTTPGGKLAENAPSNANGTSADDQARKKLKQTVS